VLTLDRVSARAGAFRLSDVSLAVGPGESHVLLGPSGAGKTTLLEVIIGLRSLSGGRVEFSGRDLAGVPAEKRGMGYLSQRLSLFPHLTVRENIVYGPRCRRMRPAEYQPVVDALVEAVGITDLLDRRPETLSGGERQRVALVRALAARPPLLLLDEPFSALNESLRHELWRLLKALQAEYGFAILMITHDLSEGFFLGDRITVLIDGEIQQTGNRDEVWRHPSTVAVAHYLGIRNIFPGTVAVIEDQSALVDCPTLGGQLRVPVLPGGVSPPSGASVFIGIRAEFVALRDEDHPPKPGEFVLRGRFCTVSVTGTDVTLVFQPDGLEATIEISIGRRLLRRFGVKVDEPVTVALPPRDLLLFTAGRT
jgi:ABC-type Fe3+/spermidine/putrescine transport system ATPase subunit